MSEHRLHEALELCLQALEQGADLQACLALFPDLKPELEPLLRAALVARRASLAIPEPRPAHSRTRALAHAAALHKGKRAGLWPSLLRSLPLSRPALATGIIGLLALLSSAGLLRAAAHALPGEPLYGVKRTAEEISLRLAPSSALKARLQRSYAKRRTQETLSLLQAGKHAKATLSGVIQSMEGNQWTVEDVPVVLLPETQILSPIDIQPGFEVVVHGEIDSPSRFVAEQIRLVSFRMQAAVESMGETTWTLSGLTLRVDDLTLIDPDLRLGDKATLLGHMQEDGTLVALAILRYLEPTALPTPTPQPTPTPPPARREIEFTARVNRMEGEFWIIGGHAVWVTPDTEVKDAVQVEDLVKVHVLISEEGQMVALEIELADEDRKDQGDGDGEREEHDEHEDEDDTAGHEHAEEGDGESEEDNSGPGSGDER